MRPTRILIAKVGLDGHNRGALVLTKALRERGIDAIYSGIRNSPQQVITMAEEKKVDVIGISSMSGAHNHLLPLVISELQDRCLHFPVICGGIIPKKDIPFLLDAGVKKVFSFHHTMDEIANYINNIGSNLNY